MPSLKHLLTPLLLGAGATAATLPLRRRSPNNAPMTSTSYGTVFDVQATIGNQSFDLLVDSGSSDLYVMQDDFTCIDSDTNLAIPQSDCLYDTNRTYTPSSSYQQIPHQIFGIEYGAGLASGVMAFENITVAGVSVQQAIGIANVSTPMGDGVNSGLIGLAYPSITSAHPSNITDNSTYWYNRLPYKPTLFTMYEQGLIQEPYFAHALARTKLNDSGPAFGGFLSFGELPPVRHEDSWAVAPVEVMRDIPLNYTSGRRGLSYWALTTSASLGSTSKTNSSVTKSFQAFFDTGNPQSYIPARIADPLHALFSPPGIYSKDLESYIVDCNAIPPSNFSLEIDGQIFEHHADDLIYQTGEGVCISAIGNSDEIKLFGSLQLNIIGVPFLKSVLGVFDFGAGEMRFSRVLGDVKGPSHAGH